MSERLLRMVGGGELTAGSLLIGTQMQILLLIFESDKILK